MPTIKGNRRIISSLILIASIFLLTLLAGCGPQKIDPPNPEIMFNELNKPKGEGPFPALVLMHGCSGILTRDRVWAKQLNEWGYLTLNVNSFAPRNVRNKCASPNSGPGNFLQRVEDAYGALVYLANLVDVDSERIGIIGWSHGAKVTLLSMNKNTPSRFVMEMEDRFKAAIAFYPPCDFSGDFYSPLILLIGEKDDWTPARRCISYLSNSSGGGKPVTIKVFPNAYHAFDDVKSLRLFRGHWIGRSDAAAREASRTVKKFFDENL